MSCRQGPLDVVFACIYARASTDLENVGLDERSAGVRAVTVATEVIAMFVFICIYADLRFNVPLVVWVVGKVFACIDANWSWL